MTVFMICLLSTLTFTPLASLVVDEDTLHSQTIPWRHLRNRANDGNLLYSKLTKEM